MKCNWRPETVAFLDFETQSEHDLKKSTARKYAKDPSTRVLTCVVKVDGVYHRIGPYLGPEQREHLCRITEGRTVVAHNASFDAAIWEFSEKLPEREWFDTMNCARAGGLPGGLDQIGERLFGRGKDKNGERLIQMLCIVKGGKVPAVGPAHGLLMEYNYRDVELLEQIYERVKEYGDPELMTVDRTINDRGVPVDRGMLMNLKELYKQNFEANEEEFGEKADGVNPRSAKQMKEWMRAKGFKPPEAKGVESLSKAACQDFAANPHKYFIGDGDDDAAVEAMMDVLSLRREVVRVGKGKAEAAEKALEDDDRLREQMVYCGGGPVGRWAGRGFQMHNMPIDVKEADVRSLRVPTLAEVQAMAAEASEQAKRRIGVSDILNAMLRHLVRAANLNIADYTGVEARCAAWVSGCRKLLDLYTRNESVYIDLGTAVFGRPITKADQQEYIISKSLALGSIYGMSGAKFKSTVKDRNMRVDVLEKMGKTVEDTVKDFRKTYPELPAVWAAYHEAVHNACKGVSTEAGKCFFGMQGTDLHIVLPSGRPMVYRNARIEPRVPAYCVLYGMPEVPVPTVVYDHPRGVGSGFLYGSKVCENVCQGTCRDIMASALVNQESAGIPVIFHVHDEIANAGAESRFKETLEIMSTPPPWASDFPLMVEGYCGGVWTKQMKSAAGNYRTAEALLGKLLHG